MDKEDTAISLQEAAKRLNLSYGTVFQRRHLIGFRLPGSRIWRVWESSLKNYQSTNSKVIHLQEVQKDRQWQSKRTRNPASGGLIYAHRVAKELDDLLKR